MWNCRIVEMWKCGNVQGFGAALSVGWKNFAMRAAI